MLLQLYIYLYAIIHAIIQCSVYLSISVRIKHLNLQVFFPLLLDSDKSSLSNMHLFFSIICIRKNLYKKKYKQDNQS